MQVKRFVVGPVETNAYIAVDEKSKTGAVIDPGEFTPALEDGVKEFIRQGVRFTHILLTHGHFDHIAGVEKIKALTGALVFIHENDKEMLTQPAQNLSSLFGRSILSPPADCLLSDGMEFDVGELHFQVLHTPGHSMGSVCLICGDTLFSGDTLFCGSIGRTDFPSSDIQAMQQSLSRLSAISPALKVLPGHGEASTMQRELEQNPYLGGNLL